MKYTIQLASEKGASSWLNALPLSKHGFDLTKTEFRDRIALHLGSEEHASHMSMRERIKPHPCPTLRQRPVCAPTTQRNQRRVCKPDG